jgi:Fic family protein
MLFAAPKPTRVDERVLREVEAMRIRLRHQVQDTPTRWTAGLRKFLTADAIAASNSIEGFRVSTVDVQDLIDGERDVEVSAENRVETLAYQQAMTYVQSLHDAPDLQIDKGLLNGLHWMLQGHRHAPARPAGRWRPGAVYVTDARDPGVAAYTAPDVVAVPALMGELVGWLAGDDGSHPLVRAAMAHLNLVSIHPWADGNGRMSRSLQTLLIAREGVLAPELASIEAWLGRAGNTWDYYRELAALGPVYRPERDAGPWVRFNLTAYHQQAQTVLGRVRRSATAWDVLSGFVGTRPGAADRLVSALHEVALAGRVRRSRYELAEGLSVQQAQRDLRDFVVAGVLAPVGRTRARYYVAGPGYPAKALEAARTPISLIDPYGD